jgi:signal transduction histidine kinase
MNSRFSLPKLLFFLLLSVLAVAGNYFNIALFFGVNFIFGSIAALVAIRLLGIVPGIITAFIGGGFTYLLWGHPYAAIIFTAEALFVGILMKRLPNNFRLLALADMIYWIFLGAPLVFVFYSHIMGMDFAQASLIALKQPVNGIMNALFAAIVVIVVDFFRRKKRIPIGTVLFNAVAVGMFLTAITLTAIYTGPMKGNAEEAVEGEILSLAKIASEIDGSHPISTKPDVEISFSKGPMENLFPVSGSLEAYLPLKKGPAMKLWKQADYIVQLPLEKPRDGFTTVIVKKSAASLINKLHQTYIHAFVILSVISLLAILCSVALTRWLVHPLQILADHSQNLPDRIKQGKPPQIPDSALLEADQFAEVFRDMAKRLGLSFGEITAAKENLEKRIEERTHGLKIAMEKAQVANHAKTDFIANVSHELRTPLTAILGSLKLIQGGVTGEVPKKMGALLGTAVRNGDRLLTLVNDVLDFSKLESGKMQITPEPAKTGDIIKSVVESTQSLISGKGLLLKQEGESELTVLAEAKRVEQIFINIIGNAVKFTESGEIVIKTKAVDGFAEFSVSDTGCGIPKDKQKSIFDSFSQADSSTTRKAGGTGLGLAISERFVKLHGGRIWVESTVDKGSIFSFTIPLEANQTS